MALLRLLAPVLSLTAPESTLESATVEFGRPHRVSNTSWADSFYGVGPASSRLVFGKGLASATAGASWSPKPTGCRSGLGGKAAFPSRSSWDDPVFLHSDDRPRRHHAVPQAQMNLPALGVRPSLLSRSERVGRAG